MIDCIPELLKTTHHPPMYVSANVSLTAAGVSVSLVMFGCAWKPVVAIHITDLDFGLLTTTFLHQKI